MKQNSTIINNWAPNAAYANRSKVLKYTQKVELVNEVKAAQSALAEWDKEPLDTSLDMMSKAEIYSEYERLIALYKSVTAATPEKNESPAEPTADEKAESAPAAPKSAEKARDRMADAQSRLDRYTAELAEKEALLTADQFPTKDEKKACTKRIASLHRKIARANKALGKGGENVVELSLS